MDEPIVNGDSKEISEKKSSPIKTRSYKKKNETLTAENNHSNGVPFEEAEVEAAMEDFNGPGSPSNSISTRTESDDSEDDENKGASRDVDEFMTRHYEYERLASERKGVSGDVDDIRCNRDKRPSGYSDSIFNPQNIRGRPSIHCHVAKDIVTSIYPSGASVRNISDHFTLRLYWILGGLLVLIIGYISAWPRSSSGTAAPIFMNKTTFLKAMEKEFPSQRKDDLNIFAKQIEICRKTTESNQQSLVYTLLYYNDDKTANSIGKRMVEYAANRFHNSSEIFYLDYNDCSGYIENESSLFKDNIKKTGTLLVTNFHKVNSQLARKFHMICDKYTPYISEKALYVLTLKTNDKTFLEKEEIHEWKQCAISTFKELWPDMEDAALNPLITRLTENILQIYPEKK